MRGRRLAQLTSQCVLTTSYHARQSLAAGAAERFVAVGSPSATARSRSTVLSTLDTFSSRGSGHKSKVFDEDPFHSAPSLAAPGSAGSHDRDTRHDRVQGQEPQCGLLPRLWTSTGGGTLQIAARTTSSVHLPRHHLGLQERVTCGPLELDHRSLPQHWPSPDEDKRTGASVRGFLTRAYPFSSGLSSGCHLSVPGASLAASWPGSLAHSAGLHTSRDSASAAGDQSELSSSQSLLSEQGSASSAEHVATSGQAMLPDSVQGLTETVGSVSTTIATGVSEVAALADQHWLPTVILQEAIEAVHMYGGLPWWAAIAATTVGIRLLLFPVVVYQMKLIAGLAKVKPEVEKLMGKMKESGYNPEVVAKYQKETRDLYRKHKTNPFAPLGGAVLQGTTFVFFFFAIQGMAKGVDSFTTGGALWFLDLTTPDPLYIFPVLTSLSFLLQVQLGAVEGLEGQPNAAQAKIFLRLLGLAMVPLTASFPKALFCYWLSTNLFSLTQATVFKMPGVRKALGLPDRPIPTGAPSGPGSASSSEKPKVFARPPPRARIETSQRGQIR